MHTDTIRHRHAKRLRERYRQALAIDNIYKGRREAIREALERLD